LVAFLGRKIGVRFSTCLEEQRAWEERELAVADLACALRAVAGTGDSDEAACAAVRQCLPEDRSLIVSTARRLGADRTSYLNDRAYRLLTATVAAAPVRPIDPAVRGLFEAERELGRCPLSGAFERLASREPRLRPDAATEWDEHERSRRAVREGRRLPSVRGRRPRLTGMHAEGADPLLHTALASSVAREYAIVTQGGRRDDEDPTPFFERRLHTGSETVVFGQDPRPRACN
jgi:hypothetical protein